MFSRAVSSLVTPRPRARASVPMVRSSAVGPNPPLMMTSSARLHSSLKASSSRLSSSGSSRNSLTWMPSMVNSVARNEPFASRVSPRVSSEPVRQIIALGWVTLLFPRSCPRAGDAPCKWLATDEVAQAGRGAGLPPPLRQGKSPGFARAAFGCWQRSCGGVNIPPCIRAAYF